MSTTQRWFVLVGGINGAGKSTFAQDRAFADAFAIDVGPSFEVINPDLVTRELRGAHPEMDLDDANRRAADECERRVAHLIEQGTTSFAIETVLSTDKYKPVIRRALTRGIRVQFTYVVLSSVDEAIARVKLRVSRGGHDVPEATIRKRWPRSLANVAWFWDNASQAHVFYNGERTPEPTLVATRGPHGVHFDPSALEVLLPRAM